MSDPTDRGERIARRSSQLRAHNARRGLAQPITEMVVRAFLLGVRVGQGESIPELDQDTGQWVWPIDMTSQA